VDGEKDFQILMDLPPPFPDDNIDLVSEMSSILDASVLQATDSVRSKICVM
jgi:hypothetical protein